MNNFIIDRRKKPKTGLTARGARKRKRENVRTLTRARERERERESGPFISEPRVVHCFIFNFFSPMMCVIWEIKQNSERSDFRKSTIFLDESDSERRRMRCARERTFESGALGNARNVFCEYDLDISFYCDRSAKSFSATKRRG